MLQHLDHESERSMPARKYVIPPQSGQGFKIGAGTIFRIIDLEGQQVADMWAFTTDMPLDWLSTSQTRDITERMFPVEGECFYSVRGVPLLTLIEDASAGPHDMLFPACNHTLYERAGLHDHPNCEGNLRIILQQEDIRVPTVPDPVNFFQNSPPRPDGRLEVLASVNPAGGLVTLRAERNLLVVLTACSVDFHPTNGPACTTIGIEIGHTA